MGDRHRPEWPIGMTGIRTYPVARALRLNFEALKRRMAEAAAEPAPAAPGPANGFVELTGAAQLPGAATGAETVVELSDEAGTRLTIRFAPGVRVDVAQLISAFRQRAAA
jgi:hypothetical protein